MRQFIAVAAILTVVGLPVAYLSAGSDPATPVAPKNTVAGQRAAEQPQAGMLDWLVAGVGRMGEEEQSYRIAIAIDPKLKEARGRGVELPSEPAFQFKNNARMVGNDATLVTPRSYKATEADILAGIARGRAAAYAFAQYQLALDPNDADALYAMARYYHEGYLTPEGLAASARYMLSAAEAGQPRAARDLAVMYRDGTGMARDTIVAYAWFTVAAMRMTDTPQHDAVLLERDEMAAGMTEGEIDLGNDRVDFFSLKHAALEGPVAALMLVGG